MAQLDYHDMWTKLSNTPVDDDGNIKRRFLHFPKGTDRDEIYHWVEDTYGVFIQELM